MGAKVTKKKNANVEIGLVKYPEHLESAVSGLTELFIVANRFARSHDRPPGSTIRVTHWQASPANPGRIKLLFDTHPGSGTTAPHILISPPSFADPISPEAAAPYAAWLAKLHAQGSTIISICGGAFLLGEANLLDGRVVTTHWYYAHALEERFPAATVDADRLLIDDGDIITAGGMTAWTDVGIRLIHRLLGPAVMYETARFMLVDPSGREQSYYGTFSPRLHHGDAEILVAQHWLQKNGCRKVDLAKMAKIAGLERRTFIRRFKRATNLNPTEYCQRLRIMRARELLEFTTQSVERISWDVGYEDPASFRRVFQKIIGLSPSEYRTRFTFA